MKQLVSLLRFDFRDGIHNLASVAFNRVTIDKDSERKLASQVKGFENVVWREEFEHNGVSAVRVVYKLEEGHREQIWFRGKSSFLIALCVWKDDFNDWKVKEVWSSFRFAPGAV